MNTTTNAFICMSLEMMIYICFTGSLFSQHPIVKVYENLKNVTSVFQIKNLSISFMKKRFPQLGDIVSDSAI